MFYTGRGGGCNKKKKEEEGSSPCTRVVFTTSFAGSVSSCSSPLSSHSLVEEGERKKEGGKRNLRRGSEVGATVVTVGISVPFHPMRGGG